MRKEQKAIERRIRMKAMAGVFDFFGVIGCAVLIIAMTALLVNLVTWLLGDLTQSFQDLQKSVTEALLVR